MKQAKKLFVFLFASLLLNACATNSSTSEDKALRRYELGMSLLKEGKSPQSIANLLDAEKLAPKNPVIKNGLSLAYLSRGRSDLALDKVNQALSLKSDFTEALISKGQILMNQNKYTEALEVLELASQDLTFINPSEVWELKTTCFMKLGHLERAQKSIQEALRLSPENCNIQIMNGKISYERKMFSKSAELFSEAVQVCGTKVSELQYYRGLSEYHIGNKIKAVEILDDLSKSSDRKYKEKAMSAISIMKE